MLDPKNYEDVNSVNSNVLFGLCVELWNTEHLVWFQVRNLTQRLNVDDGMRPGFPSSRLLSHFDHGTNFWNRMEHPLAR